MVFTVHLMAENCNGVNVDNEHTQSAVGSVELSAPGDDSKTSVRTGFRGFVPIPHVWLERYDITPYLKKNKDPVHKRELPKKRGIDEVHAQRLSEECVVKIKRDDLEKLKNVFQRSGSPSSVVSSDSETANSSDMAVKCKICDKAYNSEKKLLKHQQNKHIIYKTPNKTPKRVSFSDHVIVHEVKEYHKCQGIEVMPVTTDLKKAIVDPKSKKTIISKHQCETCGKYFSNNYGLNRHIKTQHEDLENLRCKVCEETFVWPSLLKAHKCIRINHPEMPFDDARAEILFDNLNNQNGFDDLNITDNDDYLNSVDFEIPAPIVEFRECDSTFNPPNLVTAQFLSPDKNGVAPSYKLIMQEVPIEF